MRLLNGVSQATLLAGAAALAALAAAPSDPVYREMRNSAVTDTLVVENLVLKRDAGVITLKSGAIGFTAPTMGRDTVAVFVGNGEFTFTPATAAEKAYLKRLTDQETVEETFDRALFCFSDETGRQIRVELKAHATDPRLADTLREFRKHLRSRTDTPRSMLEALLTNESMDNVEADLLTDLYRPGQAGFFSAYLHGRKHADLRFHVKPHGALPSMPSPEEVAVIDFDPGGAQEGIWYLSHLQSEITKGTASSEENNRTVQAESYRIETAIAPNDHLTGATELQFRAVTEGDRVIKLGLVSTLRVSKVTSGGQDVPFIQEDRHEDPSFYVVMPEPMKRDSTHQLRIEYEGDKVLRDAGGGKRTSGGDTW